jgi:hypothetical protein
MTTQKVTMTLRDMITNPSGPYSRQISARYAIRDSLERIFKESMSNPAIRKRFKIAGIEGSNDEFKVWIKVPSTKYEVDYDVILNLKFPEGVRATVSSTATLYSNSPSWVFTLGYTSTISGLLMAGWANALGRAAKEPSKITNPHSEYGFDKVVHQAILYLIGPAGCLTKNDLASAVTTIKTKTPDPKDVIFSAERKLFEYNKAKDKYSLALKIAKKAEKERKELDEKREKADKRGARNAKKVGAAKSVNRAGSVRKTNSHSKR